MRKLLFLVCLSLQVFVVLLFVCVYNMPRFFEYDLSCYSAVSSSSTANDTAASNISTVAPSLSVNGDDCRTELIESKTYQLVYENILYCLVVYLGPVGLLVFFNVGLVRELVQSRRNRRRTSAVAATSSLADDRRERNNITLVMLVIIVIFLVTQTPAYVNQLLYYILAETNYECGYAYFYYFHVSNLVVSSNSSLNFVVYCVCRRNFRRRLVALCRRRDGRCLQVE